jgi:two-component system alkaline phosphatase synthesis response regulator PhoP
MSRILVVEDEPTIALTLHDDLEAEGYEVDVAGDGVTAEARARTGGYDLILLDLILPRKDGFAVCHALRVAGVRTPIIVLTARAEEGDRVLGLELGADDYVTKPFSRRELIARVRAVLRRAADDPEDETWRTGALAIDFRRCEATRGGQPLALTPTEFKILRAFWRSRGRVIGVAELIGLVWGPNVHLTDRVVYTHLNNLRAKVEPDPSSPSFIVSVRGLGYRCDG